MRQGQIIEFQDKGQDFKYWFISPDGDQNEVIHSAPLEHHTWKGFKICWMQMIDAGNRVDYEQPNGKTGSVMIAKCQQVHKVDIYVDGELNEVLRRLEQPLNDELTLDYNLVYEQETLARASVIKRLNRLKVLAKKGGRRG